MLRWLRALVGNCRDSRSGKAFLEQMEGGSCPKEVWVSAGSTAWWIIILPLRSPFDLAEDPGENGWFELAGTFRGDRSGVEQ
jgi:hypothetical protein